jgi:hypothetical protein
MQGDGVWGGGDVWVGNLKTRSALPLYEAGEQFVMEKGLKIKRCYLNYMCVLVSFPNTCRCFNSHVSRHFTFSEQKERDSGINTGR